ncbi:hypothetical protein [Pseudonocardia sp.]|uniref:hypothetical protein n=1 Tax=Pseudonocardia sp. TaxID=60912 RepID=UPI003D106E93
MDGELGGAPRPLGARPGCDSGVDGPAATEHPFPDDTDIVVRERIGTRRSVVLIVDVSGSMRGEKVRMSAATVAALAGDLGEHELAPSPSGRTPWSAGRVRMLQALHGGGGHRAALGEQGHHGQPTSSPEPSRIPAPAQRMPPRGVADSCTDRSNTCGSAPYTPCVSDEEC